MSRNYFNGIPGMSEAHIYAVVCSVVCGRGGGKDFS